MECETCGGVGHSAALCTRRPAAWMDYVRDTPGLRPGWAPSVETTMAPDDLSVVSPRADYGHIPPAGGTSVPTYRLVPLVRPAGAGQRAVVAALICALAVVLFILVYQLAAAGQL